MSSGQAPTQKDDNSMMDVRARERNTLLMESKNSQNLQDANGVGPKRGMALSFQPLAISFDDVHYYVICQQIHNAVSQSAIGGDIEPSLIFPRLNNAGTVQLVVATEWTVFYRERAVGMYSVAPYAIAQAFIDLRCTLTWSSCVCPSHMQRWG